MPKIYDRLVSQLKAKGVPDPYGVAQAQLEKHGILQPGSRNLTAKGETRNAMTPAQRAKDRASRYSGGAHPTSEYSYNAKTNMATLRKK
jgi:hypothetical protein